MKTKLIDKFNFEAEKFYSLAPKIGKEVDKDNIYCEALLWALNNETVKNVALTGI